MILATLIIVIMVFIWIKRRKLVKHKQDIEQHDGTYTALTTTNPTSDHTYVTIQLSHPTGQNLILSVADEAVNVSPTPSLNPIYSTIDSERPHPPNQENQQLNNLDFEQNQNANFIECAYEVADKKNGEQDENIHGSTTVSTKCLPNANISNWEEGATAKKEQIALEEMYAVVNKKQKINKDKSPSILPHVVEDLNTTVSTIKNEEKPPPIPPHTIEELYAAVKKKPKENADQDSTASPIPPYRAENIAGEMSA